MDLAAEQITLGQLLEIFKAVHNSKSAYTVAQANWIWFVDEVLLSLLKIANNKDALYDMVGVRAEFSFHPRSVAALAVGPLLEKASKALQQGRVAAFLRGRAVKRASKVSVQLAGAGALYGFQRATATAFAPKRPQVGTVGWLSWKCHSLMQEAVGVLGALPSWWVVAKHRCSSTVPSTGVAAQYASAR